MYRQRKMIVWSQKLVLAFVSLCLILPFNVLAVESRIKDIARIAGLESINLIGYGVVVGLNGTGDKDIELTKTTVANLLENFNITLAADSIKSKNVAAVLVTASAYPFHKVDGKVEVQVSSIGDASSLEGGILLMTPLLDPNGDLYAMAQGAVTIGGFSAGSGGAGGKTLRKNHTTTGIIPSAATFLKSQSFKFFENGIMNLVLRHPDFTTADRMAEAINDDFGAVAVARDASTVTVKIPDVHLDIGQTAAFVAKLERVSLVPDMKAKIVVNERTGTIVMGGKVQIGEAVVAHGNLTVTIKSALYPSQPQAPFNRGNAVSTVVIEDVQTRVKEDKARVMLVEETTTVRELADTLNMMGATPRDLISILEALQKLGAIQMELVAM